MAESDSKTALAAVVEEADRIEEDSLFSAKTQWEAAREQSWVHFALGIPATIAAALAGVSAVADSRVWAAGLAVLSACLTGLLTFLDPKGRAARHRDAGNAFKALSNNARVFREVGCRDGSSVTQLRKSLEKLNVRRNKLNAGAPQPSRWAFMRARRGIEAGEASYRVDNTVNARSGRP